MNYILFDGPARNSLLPFTFTRPVADILVGIITIRQKWEMRLGSTTTTLTEEYLSEKFPMVEMEENVMINASFLPNTILAEMVSNLQSNQAIFKEDEVIAFFTNENQEEVDFDTYEIIVFLKERNINFYCATLQNSAYYHTQDYTKPTALVVGTEATGLTEEWRKAATHNIIIPMQGEIDSMNVSVAAAILIFEAKRQRGF